MMVEVVAPGTVDGDGRGFRCGGEFILIGGEREGQARYTE